MAHLYEIESRILEELDPDNPIHKTFVRRALHGTVDVPVTYPMLDAFLDGLCETGYVEPSDDDRYYCLTPSGREIRQSFVE